MKQARIHHLYKLPINILRWIRRRFIPLFVSGLIFVSLLFALWLWRGAHFLIVGTEISPSDLLIVLGGPTERIREGFKLYHKGYAPNLLATGAGSQLRLAHVHLDWERIIRHAARINNIPAKSFFVDEKSQSTFGDAIHSKKLMQANGWKSAIIVTSIYHTRRARMIFEKVYAGSGIRLQYHPVSPDRYRPDGWWKREGDAVIVVSEYIKLVLYWIKY